MSVRHDVNNARVGVESLDSQPTSNAQADDCRSVLGWAGRSGQFGQQLPNDLAHNRAQGTPGGPFLGSLHLNTSFQDALLRGAIPRGVLAQVSKLPSDVRGRLPAVSFEDLAVCSSSPVRPLEVFSALLQILSDLAGIVVCGVGAIRVPKIDDCLIEASLHQ